MKCESGGGTPVLSWALCGMLAGIVMQLRQAMLWPGEAYAGLALAGLLGLAAARFTARAMGWVRAVLCALALAAVGLGVTGWRAGERLVERLPASLDGRDFILTGIVAGLPDRGVAGIRFRFEVEQARDADTGEPLSVGRDSRNLAKAQVPAQVSMAWYEGAQGDGSGLAGELRAGQRWRLTARLRPPHGSLNPGGFDYELWLFEQGIGATGVVRAKAREPARLIAENAGKPIERWRQHVRDAIEAAVPDPRAAGVLAALVVGDQAAIERRDWDIFRITGVAHLMSISGLHVTMFAWLAAAVVGRAWRHSAGLMLRLPAQSAARWGGLAAAAGYALFSGWGVPSQRTVWMLASVTLLAPAGKRWPWPMVLLCAAAVVAALDPWALLQPGFWLSFVAVGLLMASQGNAGPPQVSLSPAGGGLGAARPWGRSEGNAGPPQVSLSPAGGGLGAARPWGRSEGNAGGRSDRAPAGPGATGVLASTGDLLGQAVRTQVVATVGLAPLTLVFFQQVSLVGLAANLVAIPLVTLVITPLAMLGVAMPLLWQGASWAVEAMVKVLEALAALPWAQWVTPAAPGWAMAAGVAGGLLAVLPLPWRHRALAVPLLLPLLLPPVGRPMPGSFDIIAADVGQGTAVLVRTARHSLVYDTGPRYSIDSDAGTRVMVPMLRAVGIDRIDLLVLSHSDTDHVGGADSLLAAWPNTPMLTSLSPNHPLRREHASHTECRAGQRWDWDGVSFEVLHPGPDERAPPLRPNQVSCVLKVVSAAMPSRHTALLAGDIEQGEEARLVAAWRDRPDVLAAELLLVPHHGSKTSSTRAFLDAVSPRVAVFQHGWHNRFGHPASEVWARYVERGIERIGSPACGAYRWEAGQGRCERDLERRYWHHRDDGAVP